MVSEENEPFVTSASFRGVGETKKNWIEKVGETDLFKLIDRMVGGEIECITIYGKDDERLFVIGKPGFYHITIFIDETDGYGYNDGSKDSSGIEIAGDYWPSFRVCKDVEVLKNVGREFIVTGCPSHSENWVYFSEED